MVLDGDPGKRATDQSEAFGASIKDGIHRRCLRRRLGKAATEHKKRDATGAIKKTWKQRGISVSRVMQAYRDMSVREKLLRDAESLPYLQRRHFVTRATGYTTEAAAAGGSRCMECTPSIYKKMAEGAAEGGEPTE